MWGDEGHNAKSPRARTSLKTPLEQCVLHRGVTTTSEAQ